MSDTIAVIGAGQAGGWAARTLRDQGFSGRLLLIGNERHPPYERPPLSKGILRGTPAEAPVIFDQPALQKLDIEWLPSVSCLSIERAQRTAMLSDGQQIRYDKLILCTGGRARRLAIPGAELPGVLALRNLDDAQAIADRLEPGKRLVAIGGGWIGLEVAATARTKGLDVTVVEAQPRICARTVPPVVSNHLQALHESHGTRLLAGRQVQRIAALPAGGLQVLLDDGQQLPADIVIVGVGLEPNDELARSAGLECRNGIVVDERCRTSDEHIFAAGDVTVSFNRWHGRPLRLESWQNAQDQGIAAAKAALGQNVRYDPLPRFWSDQYDATIQILGDVESPSGQSVIREDPESGQLIVFRVDGEQLMGAVGINAAARLRDVRRILAQAVPVSAGMLQDPAFDLADIGR
ncbi:MAG: NAD(P)/FAD-dependent oxidoreductase [Burkholderiaceae bacterium]